MGALTGDRPKPLVPFGGQCRLVDFSIANAARSGLDEVLLLSHYNEHRLIDYLRSAWERDGRLHIHLGPHDERLRTGRDVADLAPRPPERGTAEALLANAEFIFTDRYRDVLVLHADHVYDYDYRPMLAHHRSTGAALTIGYQAIQLEYVKLFGMVEFDAGGRLTAFVEKPAEPTSNLIFSAFCLFEQKVLAAYLDQLRTTGWQYDICRDVIEPTMRPGGMPCTIAPAPARLSAPGEPRLRNSLIPAGLRNDGLVEDSVLYPGARVAAGAVVRRSIVLPGGSVGAGVRVTDAIVLDGEHVDTDRTGIRREER
jgi:valienol-1-phosphate guanylyltransferase